MFFHPKVSICTRLLDVSQLKFANNKVSDCKLIIHIKYSILRGTFEDKEERNKYVLCLNDCLYEVELFL